MIFHLSVLNFIINIYVFDSLAETTERANRLKSGDNRARGKVINWCFDGFFRDLLIPVLSYLTCCVVTV